MLISMVRLDYDTQTRQLIIRMATTLHERFIDLVDKDISVQLAAIGNGSGRTAEFARSVKALRSSRFFYGPTGSLPSLRSKHCPDASFRHKDAEYPGVVVEVSYSQKRRALRRLAYDYLIESDGSAQVVVGLDIGYSGSRKASLSVWRHTYVTEGDLAVLTMLQDKNEEVCISTLGPLRAPAADLKQPFRNEDGTFCEGEGLLLRLTDFANEEIAEDIRDVTCIPEITIPSRRLFRYLLDAEQCEQGPPATRRSKHTLRPGAIKRPRSETPPSNNESGDTDTDGRKGKRHAAESEYEPSSNEGSFTSS